MDQLEERIARLESDTIILRDQLAVVQDDIRDLKRKRNAYDVRSFKRPKLNVDARTLTSACGRPAVAEKEAATEAEQQKKQSARNQRPLTEEAGRLHTQLTRDPNYAFSGALGSKLRPDLVDVAHALEIKEVTHGKEKLTKKNIQDLINAHFNLHPAKRQDPRFEGLFNSRRRSRVNESAESLADPSVLPSMQPRILPQPSAVEPLLSNISNVMPPAPFPTAGPLQPPLLPQFFYTHHFIPGPHVPTLLPPYSFPPP